MYGLITGRRQHNKMEKFKQKYRISSARLAHWDYGSPGLYFVTICTKNRNFYFGEITVETQNFASLNSEQRTSIEPADSNNITEIQNTDSETQNINVETQNFASLNSTQSAPVKPTGSYNTPDAQNMNTETENINTETQNFASLRQRQSAIPPINIGLTFPNIFHLSNWMNTWLCPIMYMASCLSINPVFRAGNPINLARNHKTLVQLSGAIRPV